MTTTHTIATNALALDARAARRDAAQVEIVIPVYNEEAGLDASIRRLHAYLGEHFPLAWIVTIADNASIDGTWGVACRLANQLDGVQVLHLNQKGRGRALRHAWMASKVPVVAYMDVDLSTDLDALLPLVAPLLSGHSDVAIGTRLATGSRVVRGPKREAISRSYNLLLKATLRSGFSDAQCGFKAIRNDIAHELVPMVEDEGWFFDTELLVLAEHNGLRIHEVPVDWVDDPDSRVHVMSTARDDLLGICRMLGRTVTGRATRPMRVADSANGARTPEPDLASQLVRFASIGAVSTILFALLFLGLAHPLGVLGADVVALAICTIANTAANRRLTFALHGRAGRARHHLAALALAGLPLGLTIGVLLALGAAGVTSTAVVLVGLTVANLFAGVTRFAVLRRWMASPRPAGRRVGVPARLRQWVRYGAVSVISTGVSLTVLGGLVLANAVPVIAANLIATAVGTVPSFELNRRWVWGRTGARSMAAEVLPFAVLSFAGLALSTVAVGLAAGWADAAGLSAVARTVVVEAANTMAFGSLWVAQFVILNRILFRARGVTPAPSPGDAVRTVPAARCDAA